MIHTAFHDRKIKIIAKQRDDVLRHAFSAEVSIYEADMFIIVDETGADRRNTLRKYAYSWRSSPAKSYKLLVCGEHVTALALMSCGGILDCKWYTVQ